MGILFLVLTVLGVWCSSGGADGGEGPDAGREGGDGRVGHQLRRPLHLVNGHLLPRRVRRLPVRSLSLPLPDLFSRCRITRTLHVSLPLLLLLVMFCVWFLELQADGEQRIVRVAVAEHREPQLPADNVRGHC